LGAIIIFLTFVVKEGLRDHLKDKVEAVANAQSEFLLRMQRVELILGFAKVGQQFSESQFLDKPISPQFYAEMRGGQMIEQAAHFGAFLELLERLNSKLKYDAKRSQGIQQLGDRLTQDLVKWKAMVNAQDLADPLPGAAAPGRRYPKTELVAEFAELDGMTYELYTDIFNEANQEREDGEQTLKTYTLFSYALYTLGWALGLAGSLYGFEIGRNE
jgi:hypothetical protein